MRARRGWRWVKGGRGEGGWVTEFGGGKSGKGVEVESDGEGSEGARERERERGKGREK